MSASAFSTSDDVITRTITCKSEATSLDDLVDVYEVKRCVSWIQQGYFLRVALQFPDTLLVDAPAVAARIQQCLSDVSIFILGDTSYGSCCVDEVAAQHYKADCVIHFGRACLSPTARLPVLYVFGRLHIDTVKCVAKVIETLSPKENTKIVLVYDTPYSYAADDIFATLTQHYTGLVLSKLSDASRNSVLPDHLSLESLSSMKELTVPQHSGERSFNPIPCLKQEHMTVCKCGRIIDLPPGDSIDNYSFLFIGTSDSPTLLNMMMTFNKSVFYTYDPQKDICGRELLNINKALMKRYYLIEKAKDANIVGIVAGTLGVARYRDMIDHLKALLKAAGKKSYTFVVGKLNPAKLANFAEVDIYVSVACPESSLLGQADFYRPVVSPLEMEMACNQGREWTGEYSTDFRELLPGGSMYVKTDPLKQSEVGDVSLINNKVRTLGIRERPEVGMSIQKTVAVRSDSTTVANIAQNAGEFLAGRTWKGLERQLGESPVVLATEGQCGIAANYSSEPGS
ncbi:2-(3-amino-3-carboxypropyl)histidine synthase subunit 2 [Plakobranchus ocellatus]|uniref:2-(3-amino-3-carboxypropyl)histidine synthase subunit 2 n=1 Tax=Plakobranchus ocellatus TaxID=259542 RepID=A0AAV4D711_9GAST|nr:2-(3-amino-3-carboxypropyl)histidine synthase subunit 2 [Plakobranchus ocellatus]